MNTFKKFRKENTILSQKEFARLLGITERQLRKIENGYTESTIYLDHYLFSLRYLYQKNLLDDYIKKIFEILNRE